MAPRLNARKPRPAPSPNPRASLGDNSGAPQGEEYERVTLISYVSRIVAARAEVEKAKAPFEAAKKSMNSMYKLAKAALPETTREELERRIKEMESPTRDMARTVARETRHRRWLGIVEPDQHALMLGDAAPMETKDEAHWKGEGYKAGLRQMTRKPPPECGERFVQPWMAEYDRGLKEVLEANAPKPTKSVREQAAKDFEEDNPKSAADERLAQKREEKAALEALSKLGGESDGFEASADELAAQKPREAVTGARDDEAVV